MMSNAQKQLIADIIQVSIDAAQKLEYARELLCRQELFHPQVAFARFDQQCKGDLDINDVQDFMFDNKLECQSLRHLFNVIDVSKSGRISFDDFLGFFLPKVNQQLRKCVLERPSYVIRKNQLLPYEVEWALGRLLHVEMQNYRNQKKIQQSINSDQVMECIDVQNSGIISVENLYEFFQEQQIQVPLQNLVQYFTVTCKRDSMTYEQFASQLKLDRQIRKVKVLDDLNSEIAQTVGQVRRDLSIIRQRCVDQQQSGRKQQMLHEFI